MNIERPAVKHVDIMGWAVFCGDVRVTEYFRTQALAERSLRVILDRANDSNIKWEQKVYDGGAEERRSKEFIKKLSKQYNVHRVHYDREVVYNKAMAVGLATKGVR